MWFFPQFLHKCYYTIHCSKSSFFQFANISWRLFHIDVSVREPPRSFHWLHGKPLNRGTMIYLSPTFRYVQSSTITAFCSCLSIFVRYIWKRIAGLKVYKFSILKKTTRLSSTKIYSNIFSFQPYMETISLHICQYNLFYYLSTLLLNLSQKVSEKCYLHVF